MSNALTRVKGDGGEGRLCRRCADGRYGTCPSCHQDRVLHTSDDGSKRCKRCLAGGTNACGDCGAVMAAGRMGRCETCVFRNALSKRIELATPEFKQQGTATALKEFCHWLADQRGPKAAVHMLPRIVAFFHEAETRCTDIFDGSLLMRHFGRARLRSVLKVRQWLTQQKGVVLDDTEGAQLAEDRLIKAKLDTLDDVPVLGHLHRHYHQILSKRVASGNLNLRSLRFAVSTSLELLEFARAKGLEKPNQACLDGYLKKHPGQLSNITAFVNFLVKYHECRITLPSNLADDRNRTESREILLRWMVNTRREDKQDERIWILAALRYFYGFTRKHVERATVAPVERTKRGMTLRIESQDFWIPNPIDRVPPDLTK